MGKKKLKRKGPMIKSFWYKHAKWSASKFIKKKLKLRELELAEEDSKAVFDARKLGWLKRAPWWKRAVKKVTKFLRYRKMRLGPRDFKKLRKLRKQLIRRREKIKKSNPRYARSWYKHGRRSAIKFLLRKKLIRKAKRKIKKKGLMHAHKWYNNAKRSASKFIKKKLKRKGPMIKSFWYKHAKWSASKFIKKKLKLRARKLAEEDSKDPS